MCGTDWRNNKLFFSKLEINLRHHIYISVKLSQIISMEKINNNNNNEKTQKMEIN